MAAGFLRPKPHHLLGLLAQPCNPELYDITWLKELRLRLHAERDARRGAGDDDVAGLQHHELRAVPHQVGDTEDHGLGGALLAVLAVDREPHIEILRLGDLVLGDEPGTERAERLRAFAFGPLAGALDLRSEEHTSELQSRQYIVCR